MMHLPAARPRAPLAAYQLGSCATPDEARRFVAVVSSDRTVMATLKCEHRGFFSCDFIAKVVNDSDEELSCSITGWTHGGSLPLEPGYFWIKPQSLAQIPIRAPLRLPHRFRTVSLHVQNRTLRATAEAEVPAPFVLRIAAAVVASAALAIGTFFTWHATMPTISAYTLPSQVAAGDRVIASYSYSGFGTAEYDVTRGGEHVAGGVLTKQQGTFSFPTTQAPHTYHVALSVVGPLATARRQLATDAIVFSTRSSLSIGALQPDPSVVRSGETITVRYVTNAKHGYVTLFDATNIPLERAAYTQAGISTLKAPDVDIPTQYRVQLDVGRGANRASASAGLLVLPKEDAGVPAINGVLSVSQVFRAPDAVLAAAPFSVRMLRHPSNLRLTFEDAGGTPLSSQAVPNGQSVVHFQAPDISQDTAYIIVASFSRGSVDQVLLRHVLVRARSAGLSAPGE